MQIEGPVGAGDFGEIRGAINRELLRSGHLLSLYRQTLANCWCHALDYQLKSPGNVIFDDYMIDTEK